MSPRSAAVVLFCLLALASAPISASTEEESSADPAPVAAAAAEEEYTCSDDLYPNCGNGTCAPGWSCMTYKKGCVCVKDAVPVPLPSGIPLAYEGEESGTGEVNSSSDE